MYRLYLLVCLFGIFSGLNGQSFELGDLQESYRGSIGETIKVPLRFKNNTDKTLTLVIKHLSSQLGTTQKNFFCPDNNCLDQSEQDFVLKLEPNQSITTLQIALEAGLAHGASSARYLAVNKYNPSESVEFELNFLVEERFEKQNIYSSEHIMLHEVYPNPITDQGFIDYTIFDSQVKAKIVIHNILGNAMDEFSLPPTENKVKIRAEVLNAGIYFYTLYVDNEGVVTRKLIVKK